MGQEKRRIITLVLGLTESGLGNEHVFKVKESNKFMYLYSKVHNGRVRTRVVEKR